MAHFAQVIDGIVRQVIVAEPDVIYLFADGQSEWIQTSFNTRAGEHLQGGTPLRKNYAGIGFTYDPVRDAFIPPKHYDSWVLDEDTCLWVAPMPQPDAVNSWQWDEATQSWTLAEF